MNSLTMILQSIALTITLQRHPHNWNCFAYVRNVPQTSTHQNTAELLIQPRINKYFYISPDFSILLLKCFIFLMYSFDNLISFIFEGQNPSTVKTGKARHVTKGTTFSSVDHDAANSKTTKLSAPSQGAVTMATPATKLDTSNKPPTPKINSKLTLSVFQLLLTDLVSESSSLMEFLTSTCCTNLKERDGADMRQISPRPSNSKFLSKKFPNLSSCHSKIKAASLRILKNPPFFETEVTYSKFKKYPLFTLTKPSTENEEKKESLWKYLEALLKDETESSIGMEPANPVEIIPSLEVLNLEPGSSIYKRPKNPVIFNSAPNLKDEYSNLTNCETVESQDSELCPSPSSKEPRDSSSLDPVPQRSHSIPKITTPAVSLGCLFEENPQDLEDLEVFYRLAEEILKINPTSV